MTIVEKYGAYIGSKEPVLQEFVQRTAAQKVLQEVLEKLSPAEVPLAYISIQEYTYKCHNT